MVIVRNSSYFKKNLTYDKRRKGEMAEGRKGKEAKEA